MTATRTVHFHTLDALRGLAAVAVVWFHSPLVNGTRPALIAPGNIYVDFFFILSGFVLAHAYLPRIDAGLDLGRFVLARLARLWPLHLVMTAAFVAYGLVQDGLAARYGIGDGANPANTGAALLCNLLLIHALGLLDGLSWNYPSWSISVEFWTGLLFFGFARAGGHRHPALIVLIALAGYAALLSLTLPQHKGTLLASHDYGIFRCIGGFFGGVALYQILQHRDIAPLPRTALQLGSLGLVLGLLSRADGAPLAEALTILAFYPLIGTLAVTRGPVTRVLTLPPLLWLGRISYSVYLIHALILSLSGFGLRKLMGQPVLLDGNGRRVIETVWATPLNLGIIGLVIGLASLSHVWIERPAQRAILAHARPPRDRPQRC